MLYKRCMIEQIDFYKIFDEGIRQYYIDKFYQEYPFNLYKNRLELYKNIVEKVLLPWSIIKNGRLIGVAITSITDLKILNVHIMMDKHSLSNDILEEGFGVLEKHAKENNCKGIEIIGRRAWEKIAKKFDYEFLNISMLKRLA